jgi:alpha-1,2-mannosyltransferase
MELPGVARLRVRRRMVVVIGLAVANVLAVGCLWWHLGPYLDLEVYRLGAQTWLDNGSLYGALPVTSVGIALPFTYPPVAAVLLTPFTLVSVPVGGVLLAVAGLVMVVIVIAVGLGVPSRWWIAAATALPVSVALEPVRETLNYGQVNLLLMGLVVLDCLVLLPRWPRGRLLGLAAAVKLTPAGFALFFLLRRDRQAVVVSIGTFLVLTAAGFVLAKEESLRYWSTTLYDTGRIGTVHYAGNQSLQAVLARFGLQPPFRTLVWLLGAAIVLAFAVVAIRRALEADRPDLALGLNALAVLVVSPVSWTHHWVWAVPVLLALCRMRTPLPLALAAAGATVFTLAPQWWWPNTANAEYSWDIVQQVLGNAYLYFAVLVLVLASRSQAFDRSPPAVAAGRTASAIGQSTPGGPASGTRGLVAGPRPRPRSLRR